MTDFTYPYDPTGAASTNFIAKERHVVTYDNNADYHFIVPKFSPFFAGSLRAYKVSNGARTPMTVGTDFYLGLHFQMASTALTKPVFGGIVLTNVSIDFEVEIDYQTLGGEWTLDTAGMMEAITNIVKNPAGVTWEQVANVQKIFPPLDHLWEFEDIQGQSELIAAVDRISNAIAAKVPSPGSGAPSVTKSTIGLGKVENFPPASLMQALDPENNETNLTPKMLWGLLDHLGILDVASTLDQMREHMNSRQNPHAIDANTVGLSLVANLEVATEEEIIRNANVRKYMTLDQTIRWFALHGCTGKEDIKKVPPLGAKLHEYCTDNYDRMGLYADGVGGTYAQIIEGKSEKCGYKTKTPIVFEPAGTVVNEYCSNGNKLGLVSNGLGSYLVKVLETQSAFCGGTVNPAAGTVISTSCDGGTKVSVIATGNGGTRIERIENSTDCKQTTFPPAGDIKRTFCSKEAGSYDMMAERHDGTGGTYEVVLERNSKDCGYIAPTLPPVQTNPPRGSAAGTECDTGTKTLFNKFHDGNGGFYREVAQFNSPACGYVAPTPSPTNTPAPTPRPNRTGKVAFSTTHTTVRPTDPEVMTATLTGWNPNQTYRVGFWVDSSALPQPNPRETVFQEVMTDGNGDAVVYQRGGNSAMLAPLGIYYSWVLVNNVKSNIIPRTLIAG